MKDYGDSLCGWQGSKKVMMLGNFTKTITLTIGPQVYHCSERISKVGVKSCF